MDQLDRRSVGGSVVESSPHKTSKREKPFVNMKLSLLTVTLCTFPVAFGQELSTLWGQDGNLWSPGNSLLRDFSDVGYMNGDVPVPTDQEWPNMVSVLDYGATPDDNEDDSQAFIDAIADCPPNAAIYVPNGKYIILQQIRVSRDNFVLRGQDMFETVLYFPKYLSEIYPTADESYGYKGGFFHVDGGTQRSIENLTFEFRPQTKMGFWEFRGANAIKYKGGVSNSWIKNIHFRNVDFGVEFNGATQVSVLNLYFDHNINRPAFVDSNFNVRTAAYLGVGLGMAHKCLIHNIEYTGDMFHDFDIIGVPSFSVVSHVSGPSVELRHHSMGAHHNLYTDISCGVGSCAHGLEDSRMMHNETHWGIDRVDRDWPAHPDADFQDALNSNHVFVGYAIDYPDTYTDTFYYENIDPKSLLPRNIYLAQLQYFGKPFPEVPSSLAPIAPELTGDVRLLNPIDDITPGRDPLALSIPFDGYLKFDLRQLQDLNTIARATLKLSTKSRTATTFTMTVASVADDSWTQDTLSSVLLGPDIGAPLDSVYIDDEIKNKWWDLDVTSYVQQEWASDKIVSFYVGNDRTGSFLGGFHTRESGNAPLLVIERVPDPVPGPPAPPTGMYTLSREGHIILDWEDNTEGDFAYYNVYRFPAPNADHPVAQGLTLSEYTDISATEDRGISEMPSDTLYIYTITAVDTHGYESVQSTEFVGNTLSFSNDPPTFGSDVYTLSAGVLDEFYLENISDKASDPEYDMLYYFKVSGPSWLSVSFDGTISGTPATIGTFEIVIQVNALGGRDHATFFLNVANGSTVQPPTSVTPSSSTPTNPTTTTETTTTTTTTSATTTTMTTPTTTTSFTTTATTPTTTTTTTTLPTTTTPDKKCGNQQGNGVGYIHCNGGNGRNMKNLRVRRRHML